jgi:hypothetical protein
MRFRNWYSINSLPVNCWYDDLAVMNVRNITARFFMIERKQDNEFYD